MNNFKEANLALINRNSTPTGWVYDALDNGIKIIRTFNSLYDILDSKNKETYTGSVPYSEDQLVLIEETMESEDNLFSDGLKRVITMGDCIQDKINKERMTNGEISLIHAHRKLQEFVDMFLPLDDKDCEEIRKEIYKGMASLTYGFSKVFAIVDGESTKEVDQDLALWCRQNNEDLQEVISEVKNYYTMKFIPVLSDYESQPEVWRAFMNDLSPKYRTLVLDYAEFVTLKDIVEFNKGNLTVDDDYIALLNTRYIQLEEEGKIDNQMSEGYTDFFR